MPERTSYAPGTPNWVDLGTTDQAAAKDFYGALFGWTFVDNPVDETNTVFYTMASRNDSVVAGIGPLNAPDGVPPHWNSYVSVDDIDATVAKVAGAGGTVIAPPFPVVEAGRMAVIQDPTGALLMLWEAKDHIGAQLVNEAGAFTWTELLSPDVPKAAAFYATVLGWGAKPQGDPVSYTEFTLGGESIAGAMNPPMPGIPPSWGIYFATDDTDATVAQAQSLGGALMAGPMDIEPGRFAVLADPQGAVFSVIKMSVA